MSEELYQESRANLYAVLSAVEKASEKIDLALRMEETRNAMASAAHLTALAVASMENLSTKTPEKKDQES